MPSRPNKLSQFWQELKRRRVIHVIVVYATAAFVIIELVGNVYETLNLPDWTPALTLIILAVGFPIALIFSWIFDVTPGGIEKTKPSIEVSKEEKTAIPNSWRIATYVSVVIIIGLLTITLSVLVFLAWKRCYWTFFRRTLVSLAAIFALIFNGMLAYWGWFTALFSLI
jgi:hypothetical protein